MTAPAPRRVLVTGGAHRLGRAIVEGLADDGARVAVHYHRSEGHALDVTRRLGDRAVLLQADLSEATAAAALPVRAAEALGGLDVLVNSAAILVRQPLGSVEPEDWDRVMDLNLRAYFFAAQGAAPFLRQARGHIINISDIAAFDPWPAFIPHCVSKAGVEMLTKGLAAALAPEVTVNGIAPGAVLVPEGWTPEAKDARAAELPMGRLGDPADVLHAVRYLLDARYATGTTVVVDGGHLVRSVDPLS